MKCFKAALNGNWNVEKSKKNKNRFIKYKYYDNIAFRQLRKGNIYTKDDSFLAEKI
jgi:hypothetical protein